MGLADSQRNAIRNGVPILPAGGHGVPAGPERIGEGRGGEDRGGIAQNRAIYGVGRGGIVQTKRKGSLSTALCL